MRPYRPLLFLKSEYLWVF